MKLTPESLTKVRRAYRGGENLTELLKREKLEVNSLAIEVIYDLQAGSYTQYVEENPEIYSQFVSEVSDLIRPLLFPHASVLDVGTGEGSTFIPILKKLNMDIDAFALDISWSRLSYALVNSKALPTSIEFAVGNMLNVPLSNGSVDFVLTIHALEPNGGKEIEILKELSRIARKYVILVEPDFNNASHAQKVRMKELSYIGSLDSAVAKSGLRLIQTIPIKNNFNPLNCASVYILKVDTEEQKSNTRLQWVDPIFHDKLHEYEGGLRNPEGLWFPVLRGIPFLRADDAKLTLTPAE
jgi:ubiquinone/menaquinone biosynthesis C-methylase UbiE